MTLAHLFRHQNIGGKDVYVVDDHHQDLAPWALVRHQLGQAPNLITIDHHTDVYEAFLGHARLRMRIGVMHWCLGAAQMLQFRHHGT